MSDAVTIAWSRRTVTLDAAIEALFRVAWLGVVAYVYLEDPSRWYSPLLVVAAVAWSAALLLGIARYAVKAHSSEVARLVRETAFEQHPDGCMCPFCMKERAERGQEVDPYG